MYNIYFDRKIVQILNFIRYVFFFFENCYYFFSRMKITSPLPRPCSNKTDVVRDGHGPSNLTVFAGHFLFICAFHWSRNSPLTVCRRAQHIYDSRTCRFPKIVAHSPRSVHDRFRIFKNSEDSNSRLARSFYNSADFPSFD